MQTSKVKKLLQLRDHPSFGMALSPLFTNPETPEDAPPLPDPTVTGTLTSDTINILFTIATFPVSNWNLDPKQNAFDFAEFTFFVNLKTQQVPSYYTIYNQTNSLFGELVVMMGQAAALNYLYTPSPGNPPGNFGAIRNWAIQEFLSLMITSGNFRTYGWKNYPGWMGGPYNDPNNLPYRGINS